MYTDSDVFLLTAKVILHYEMSSLREETPITDMQTMAYATSEGEHATNEIAASINIVNMDMIVFMLCCILIFVIALIVVGLLIMSGKRISWPKISFSSLRCSLKFFGKLTKCSQRKYDEAGTENDINDASQKDIPHDKSSNCETLTDTYTCISIDDTDISDSCSESDDFLATSEDNLDASYSDVTMSSCESSFQCGIAYKTPDGRIYWPEWMLKAGDVESRQEETELEKTSDFVADLTADSSDLD